MTDKERELKPMVELSELGSSKMPENPPAFPQSQTDLTRHGEGRGMTLRDYFAGQALIAIASDGNDKLELGKDDLAKIAYIIADAMLQERLK